MSHGLEPAWGIAPVRSRPTGPLVPARWVPWAAYRHAAESAGACVAGGTGPGRHARFVRLGFRSDCTATRPEFRRPTHRLEQNARRNLSGVAIGRREPRPGVGVPSQHRDLQFVGRDGGRTGPPLHPRAGDGTTCTGCGPSHLDRSMKTGPAEPESAAVVTTASWNHIDAGDYKGQAPKKQGLLQRPPPLRARGGEALTLASGRRQTHM
jgi:hypothetical protein